MAKTGGDSLSYFLLLTNNFIRKMPKDNEITNFVNNSSDVCTLNIAINVSSQSFQNTLSELQQQ